MQTIKQKKTTNFASFQRCREIWSILILFHFAKKRKREVLLLFLLWMVAARCNRFGFGFLVTFH